MTIPDAKNALEYKVAAEARAMPSDTDLSELFYEALLYVASKCAPSELIRKNSDERCFRNLEHGFFICFPDKPIFDAENASYNAEKHIMIDEPLTYAVINHVAFLLTKLPIYHQMANEIIGEYIANDGREGDSVYL